MKYRIWIDYKDGHGQIKTQLVQLDHLSEAMELYKNHIYARPINIRLQIWEGKKYKTIKRKPGRVWSRNPKYV